MPQVIPGTRALPIVQKGFREGYKAILRPAMAQVSGVLLRAAGDDGKIDPKREVNVTRQIGEIVQRVFVGGDGRNAFGHDGVAPLAEYPKLINKSVIYTTVKAVQNQHNWLKRNLPDDIYNWLKRARRPQNIAEMITVSARMNRGYVPKVLAEYDPLHLWVDPNGYRLNDRIWRTSIDTWQRLDAMVSEQIRNGNSAINISKKAEQFMLPGRADLRTNKPYGKDASYRGMVLGRTEITRAHGETTMLAAQMNPYVDGMDWVLSGSHPKDDECDELATVDSSGNRLAEPYPLDEFPDYPAHPQCLCNEQSVVTDSAADVTAELRAFMEDGDDPPITPAADDTMYWLLLGAGLYEWWQRNISEVAA